MADKIKQFEGGDTEMIQPFKFNLGEELKDSITGFKGICAARTQYISGCNRYSLQKTQLNKSGKPEEWCAFDEDYLVKIGEGLNKQVKKQKPRGGVYHDSLVSKKH